MTATIHTIGYEGASPECFDNAVLKARIQLVVDIRAVAVSRKRGFSKTALSERLHSHKVEYVHLRGLGDPKPGRLAARAGDLAGFRKIYSAHLRTDEAVQDFEKLEELLRSKRIALLCYEAEAKDCHRTIVAEKLRNGRDIRIVHLVPDLIQGGNLGRKGTNHNSREGMASA